MRIRLIPFIPRLRRDLGLVVEGDTLHVKWREGRKDCDDSLDMSDLAEGDRADWDGEGKPWWLAGAITRTSGQIVVPVMFPVETGCHAAAAFPDLIETADGEVVLPDPRGPRETSPKFQRREVPDPADPTIL